MSLLLDTHALLWHFEDSASLSRTAKNLINDKANQLFISTASLWEMSIKTGLGKLKLADPVPDLVAGYVSTGTTLLSIDPKHAYATSSLPWHHRDPFDRMLITQAQLEGLTLVTQDEMFKRYEVPLVW